MGAGRDLPESDLSLAKSPTASEPQAGCQPFPGVASRAVVAAVCELPPTGCANKPSAESRKGHLEAAAHRKSGVLPLRPSGGRWGHAARADGACRSPAL